MKWFDLLPFVPPDSWPSSLWLKPRKPSPLDKSPLFLYSWVSVEFSLWQPSVFTRGGRNNSRDSLLNPLLESPHKLPMSPNQRLLLTSRYFMICALLSFLNTQEGNGTFNLPGALYLPLWFSYAHAFVITSFMTTSLAVKFVETVTNTLLTGWIRTR